MTKADKLNKLKDVLELLDNDYASYKDVARLLKSLSEAIQNTKGELTQAVQSNTGQVREEVRQALESVQDAERRISEAVKGLGENGKKELEALASRLRTEMTGIEAMIPRMPDLAPLERRIDQAVVDLENKIPDLPEELGAEAIRDKLESLDGEKRLDKSAIKGIEELEQEIRTNQGVRVLGGRAGISLFVAGVKKGLVQSLDIAAGLGATVTHSKVNGLDTITIGAEGGSGITRSIVVTSGNVTAGDTASTDYVYYIAGAHAVSLPTAVGNTNRYSFTNQHSANVTITPDGAQTIHGGATLVLAPDESVDLISNGTNWRVF